VRTRGTDAKTRQTQPTQYELASMGSGERSARGRKGRRVTRSWRPPPGSRPRRPTRQAPEKSSCHASWQVATAHGSIDIRVLSGHTEFFSITVVSRRLPGARFRCLHRLQRRQGEGARSQKGDGQARYGNSCQHRRPPIGPYSLVDPNIAARSQPMLNTRSSIVHLWNPPSGPTASGFGIVMSVGHEPSPRHPHRPFGLSARLPVDLRARRRTARRAHGSAGCAAPRTTATRPA
jgi:hypothetical protein